MLQTFFKYHGAGNDFFLADNRDGHMSLTAEQIQHLCDRHTGFGADGVMLLETSQDNDFRMVYYNPDGSTGMMCGNGGRCIVAFAADLGVVSGNFNIVFDAPDGVHSASLLHSPKEGMHIVRLRMKDVHGMDVYPEEKACFLDTGTRHLVKFVSGLKEYPVLEEGKKLRFDERFAPVGTNVNFVETEPDGEGTLLNIRTFEKGVEYETLACGTGIVASAMAAYSQGYPGKKLDGGKVAYTLKASIATLEVEFVPSGAGKEFMATETSLTGPAEYIGEVRILL